MHLNASHNGNSVYTVRTKVLFRWQSWGENKQTNMQFSVKGGKLAKPRRLHLYLQPVKAAGPLPLTRTLPRPCCWNKAPTVGACSGENAGPPPPWLRLGPLGRAEVFFRTGWWGVGRLSGGRNEWRMGCVWEPCPRPACPLVKRASALPICNADSSSCRLTLGKGASMAGIKQASADGKCHSHFDSWPPFFFFANLDLLLLEKKPPPPLLCASVTTRARLLDCHIRFQGGKKRKQSSELPFTSGAVIVIHIEVVWNTPG